MSRISKTNLPENRNKTQYTYAYIYAYIVVANAAYMYIYMAWPPELNCNDAGGEDLPGSTARRARNVRIS